MRLDLDNGVADWIGVDDRDPRVRYEYGQDRGKPRHYGVRVEIQPGLAL